MKALFYYNNINLFRKYMEETALFGEDETNLWLHRTAIDVMQWLEVALYADKPGHALFNIMENICPKHALICDVKFLNTFDYNELQLIYSTFKDLVVLDHDKYCEVYFRYLSRLSADLASFISHCYHELEA